MMRADLIFHAFIFEIQFGTMKSRSDPTDTRSTRPHQGAPAGRTRSSTVFGESS